MKKGSNGEIMDISDELVNFRKKYQLSRRYFARIVGVSVLTISNWETGKTTPSEKKVSSVLRKMTLYEQRTEKEHDTTELKNKTKTLSTQCEQPHTVDIDESLLPELKATSRFFCESETEKSRQRTAQAIAEFRQFWKLSKRELADQIGVSEQIVEVWEKALAYPNNITVSKIFALRASLSQQFEFETVSDFALSELKKNWYALLLRKCRTSLMSQSELASKLHLSEFTIQRWEEREAAPNKIYRQNIEEILHMKFDSEPCDGTTITKDVNLPAVMDCLKKIRTELTMLLSVVSSCELQIASQLKSEGYKK